MNRVPALHRRFPAALPALMLAAFAPSSFAADGFDSTYVEVGYGIDSTIEAYGQSYDSDDSYRIVGSYQFTPHLRAGWRARAAGPLEPDGRVQDGRAQD